MNKKVEYQKLLQSKGFIESLKKQTIFLTSEGKRVLGLHSHKKNIS